MISLFSRRDFSFNINQARFLIAHCIFYLERQKRGGGGTDEESVKIKKGGYKKRNRDIYLERRENLT